MSTTHRTLVGDFFHEVGVIIHNFHIGPVNASNVQNYISEGVKVANVIKAVSLDCKGIKDPAQLINAVAVSVIKHHDELPLELQGTAFESYAIKICAQITGLPLDAIEAEIKALILANGRPANPAS